MGIYLNPKNGGFQEALNSQIYVDKTGLIEYTNSCLNTKQKYICVSRPRRFGKSMALEMLAAYYSCGCDSGDLFSGLKIAGTKTFPKYLNKYDVIYLNMQHFLLRTDANNMTKYLEQAVLDELREAYGSLFSERTVILAEALEKIYAKADKQFIFLIDEWDCVMRERQESETLQKQYLDFLRSLLKDQPYVALAYMTGILPVKKYGQHSALNMFSEHSMTGQYDLEEYTGFTQDEVKALCQRFDMDYTETSSWYDGYMFKNFKHIYNPRSVVSAMSFKSFSSYWASTETYDALKIYIDMDFDGLRGAIIQMLSGERIKVNTLSFQNDMRSFKVKDDVLTLLIHLGYLGYDAQTEEAFIPNKEIIREFENAMSVGGWSDVMQILKASEKLLSDTLSGNEKEVAEALDKAHTEATSILTYNDENSLSCAIGLAYYSARKDYRLIREFPAGKGFADIIFLPLPHSPKPALIVELKYDEAADTAIQQIKNRQYAQALEGYSGEIMLVAISYSKADKNKRHSCIIEKVEK